jgi:Transposase DDE domain
MIIPPAGAVPLDRTKKRRIPAKPKPGSRPAPRMAPPLIEPTPEQAEAAISILPPELAALRRRLPADVELPLDLLATLVLPRVPLANAALTAWSYLLSPEALADLFRRHRGRSYEDILTFPEFVALIRDALVLHEGSGLASLERADERGELPTCQEAVYAKLRRTPIGLSPAFLEETTERLRAPLPGGTSAEELPGSLEGIAVVVLDGKQIKDVAKRLKPVRGRPGKVVGGKVLVAYLPRRGLAVAMAAEPDGEANDIRLMPAMIPRARARVAGVRLWVGDRQFCDLDQPARLTEGGDHFLLRRSLRLGFHADPGRPARSSVDAQGRSVTEQWGWIGAPREKRRRYVRQVHLARPGAEDVYLVTDLLDEAACPAEDLLAVYLRRWEIERVIQKIVEVFELRRLIGSTPRATIFQAAFCLVLYNLLQVMRTFVAAGQEGLAAESVSLEKLFDDVQAELTAVAVLFPAATIAGWFAAEWSREEVASRLERLLGGAWKPRYRKATRTKPRPKVKRAKCSGAHTSVQKILDAERKKRGQPQGVP